MKRLPALLLLLLALRVSVASAQTSTSTPTIPKVPQATAPRDAQGQAAGSADWSFAVCGDSRDCGDVVLPTIAARVRAQGDRFYWHLGDLRSLREIDADLLHDPATPQDLSFSNYLTVAWDDFVEHQIKPFGTVPFVLGIGNHEVIGGHTRSQFVQYFRAWLDTPMLRGQGNDPKAPLTTWYTWTQGPVAFIYLDNATPDEFTADQEAWLEGVLERACNNSQVQSIVVGMHEALPFSYSLAHSMNQCGVSTRTGLKVYQQLLEVQRRKRVYVLASHSHYYMANIYNTPYWQQHGGVLPGWIVGTGGARRNRLPKHHEGASEALEKTYGYLRGTVHQDGVIDFVFQPVEERDVPADVVRTYGANFVHEAFTGNIVKEAPKH